MALSIRVSRTINGNQPGEALWAYQWAVSEPGIGAIESAVLDAREGVGSVGIFGASMYAVTRAINNISLEPIVRDINLSCGLTVSRV